MARYFFGNTLAAFFRTSALVVDGDTTAGAFDSGFVASCLKIPAGADYIQTTPFIDAASTTTLWTHCEFYGQSMGSSNSTPLIAWLNSSGTVVARLSYSGSGVFQFQYWNGSSFTNLGSTFTLTVNTRYRLDVKLTAGVSGTVDIYVGGTLVASASGMNAAVTNFATVRFGNHAASFSNFFSQVLGADFDTRDSRLSLQLANGNGGSTDGTGAYTDINETVLDETTAISLASSGQKKTFTHAAFTLPAGYQINAVCVAGRGRINGSGPSDGKFDLRISSTNYASSSLSLNTGYEPRGRYWDTDPSTATFWTQSGYNAAEFGVEAA